MSFGTSSFPSEKTPWQLIAIILELKIPLVFIFFFYSKNIPLINATLSLPIDFHHGTW